jgi:hypothetical protein
MDYHMLYVKKRKGLKDKKREKVSLPSAKKIHSVKMLFVECHKNTLVKRAFF